MSEEPIEGGPRTARVSIEPSKEHRRINGLDGPVDIEAAHFTIGRRAARTRDYIKGELDLRISEFEPYALSKRHCVITQTTDGVFIEDLSRRGTFVNDLRLGGKRHPGKKMKLEVGTHHLVLGPRDSGFHFVLTVA